MRTLHLHEAPYDKGASPLQHALKRAGLYKGPIDDLYGPGTAHGAQVAKYRLGYPSTQIHRGHEYAGLTLLTYLTGKKPLPPSYLKRRRARLGGSSSDENKVRREVVANYRYLIAHEPAVHYRQSRPIPFPPPRTIPSSGLYTDCSGSVTIACKWAGAPDPSGLKFSGLGFTGTMLTNLPHIDPSRAQPGDLVVFGPYPGHHVVMLLDKQGSDWATGSHGREGGPLVVALNVEAGYQPKPLTFLSIL